MRYIDADALDDTVQRLNEQGWQITRGDYKRIDSVLFEMPTADVREVVHGEWVLNDDQVYECKDCGYIPSFDGYTYYNYCPNCGAKMDERREDGEIH